MFQYFSTMGPAGIPLPGYYDPLIVALSAVIAVAASYAALDLAGRIGASKGLLLVVWLSCGSIAMGIGIWSMHFTGMLAFRLPVPVRYHWPLVLWSYVVAVSAAALAALYIASRKKMSGSRTAVGGVVIGCGIAALHYISMAAMRMAANSRFNLWLVSLSVAFAIAFSYSALRLAFYCRKAGEVAWRKIGSALVMGAAICAMHYTGMAAATFTSSSVEPNLSRFVAVTSLETSGLIAVTLLVLSFAIVSSLVDRRIHAHALDLAVAEAKMELAYVTRAAALGQLAASIAHEINQPLGAIVNSANASLRWLAMQPPNLEEARTAAAGVVSEANRANEVIARIRALLKKEAPQVEQLDLNELTNDTLRLVGSEILNHRIVVQTDVAPDSFVGSGDRVQIQQVLFNLIINAIEAMSSVQDRPRELRIRAAADSDAVRVAIQDSGIGLDQGDPERIFRPFYTTKRGGAGMGLAISRSIIEAHGGRLWARPAPSRGAIFEFTLPKSGGAG
jgi:NO-binding membrane sensor protein with MHYT domain